MKNIQYSTTITEYTTHDYRVTAIDHELEYGVCVVNTVQNSRIRTGLISPYYQ